MHYIANYSSVSTKHVLKLSLFTDALHIMSSFLNAYQIHTDDWKIHILARGNFQLASQEWPRESRLFQNLPRRSNLWRIRSVSYSWKLEVGDWGIPGCINSLTGPWHPSLACTPSNSVYPLGLQSGSVQPTEITDCEHTVPPCGRDQLPCQ